MSIENQILGLTKRFGLKDKALSSIDDVIDASIESDLEQGIDFLEGHDRADLIFEFGRFELHVDLSGNPLIATRINIYSKKLYGPNFDVPVGYYIEQSSLTGEHIDEFLKFDWTPIDFNISYYIERINKLIPKGYFKRNVPEYEFATYINHSFALFQVHDYEGVAVFIKRSLDYIEKYGQERLDGEYLAVCFDYLRDSFGYIVKEQLVDSEKIDRYGIKERLITKS